MQPHHSRLLLQSPIVKLEDWVAGSLRKRMDDPGAGPDVFKHLLEVDQESGWKHNWEELRSDAMVSAAVCGLRPR